MLKGIQVVVPAGGVGRRMNCAFPGIPKALVPLAGRCMLDRTLDTLATLELGYPPIVVVSPTVEGAIRSALNGRNCRFAVQREPRGTGDAVASARCSIPVDCESILVVFPDQPLIPAGLLVDLMEVHRKERNSVTMATVQLADFSGWRSAFMDWGRVVRNMGGVGKIVESADLITEQKEICEVNPSIYCFATPWVWTALSRILPKNNQREYLLTDVIEIAVRDGVRIGSVQVADARFVLGANTPSQLKELEGFL